MPVRRRSALWLLYFSTLLALGFGCVFARSALAVEAFGVEKFENTIEASDGSPDIQASTHPYAMTTTIMFDHVVSREEETYGENGKEEEVPLGEPEVFAHIFGDPKRLELNLPAGEVLDPSAVDVKCTEVQLETNPSAGGSCPAASAVGIATIYISDLGEKVKAAVYDMAPPAGVPAELGVNAGGVGFVLHIVGKIRADDNYAFSSEVSEISQISAIYGLKLTLWGDPSDPSHDAQRGVCASRGNVQKAIERELFEDESTNGAATREYRFSCPVQETGASLLTMPGSCTGRALETGMRVSSWQEPDEAIEPPPATSPPVTGCEDLAFSPSLDVQLAPEVVATESPSGLDLDIGIPHEEGIAGLAEADLKSMTVTLPAGIAISPSVASGLRACTPSEIGLHSEVPPSCPDASKLGEVQVSTPLLQAPLSGAVYLATQETLAGALIGLYIVAEGDGVLVKLTATATLDPSSGQITLALAEIPQLPLQEIKLHLFGGSRAALQTPPDCGTYTVASQLAPWSGGAPGAPASDFAVDSGCEHAFRPSFTAGTTDNRAGAFSPLTIAFSRRDGEQRLASMRVLAPPGLLGALGSLARCPEPQASEGACPASSAVGEATLALGPGEDPYWIAGAGIYLTGPYRGAPFGLAIVIPMIAGPFDLGVAVVRARVAVDSHTAQVAIESDPLPSIMDGIPLDIRTVELMIDRPGFMFNPTSCAALAVTGTLGSVGGASVGVGSPFQAVDCASLPFKPKLTASTQARTSRRRGASLVVKIAAGAGQANLGKVRVILPPELPARLTTLQRACPAPVFDVNPASCPADSVVGTVTVLTRLLGSPLSGPAYLVSHGAAFPDLVFVLQGEGIELYLDGNIDVKKDLTSTTFNSIPDVPIATLTAELPEGPHSILAANVPVRARGSICGRSLQMSTTLTAQDGFHLTRATKIAVTGCHPAATHDSKHKQARRKRRGR